MRQRRFIAGCLAFLAGVALLPDLITARDILTRVLRKDAGYKLARDLLHELDTRATK